MNLVSDDSRIFSLFLSQAFMAHRLWAIVNTGKNILESSEIKLTNLPPYVFDVDYVAKIRSELSISVLEKKLNKIIA